MKQLYSPNPWEVAQIKPGTLTFGAYEYDILDAGGRLICKLPRHDNPAACQADARLISNAPELLGFVAEMARFIRQEKEELEIAGYGPPMSFYLGQAEALVRRASLPFATQSEAPGRRERT